MKPKQFLIVIIAFAILGALYLLQQSGKVEVSQDLGFEKLLSSDFTIGDVQEIKCYRTGQEDKAVVLKKKDDKWEVGSKFDAPATESKVQELLEKLGKLEGELRSSNESVLEDYGISDDQALNLMVYGENDQSLGHLLLGKQGPRYQETFVRRSGSPKVYLVSENLRSLFGLYGGQADKDPDSKQWTDLNLVQVPSDEVTRIETTTPYRDLVLKYIEKPVIQDVSGEEPVVSEPERIPVLVEPVVSSVTKENGINRLSGAFASVTASDVIDRGGFEKYGLVDPQASATVTTQAGEIHRLFVGSPVPAGNGAHYVCIEGDDLVYKVDRWKLDGIFIKLSDLVDLKAPQLGSENIAGFFLEKGDSSYPFVLQEGEWKVDQPDLRDQLKSDAVDKLLEGVAQIQPQDQAYKTSKEVTGLDSPDAIIRLFTKDGKGHEVAFGNEVPLTDGSRFVQIDEHPEIYTITKANYNTMVPPVTGLFDLSLFDFNAEDIYLLQVPDATGELMEITVASKMEIASATEPNKLSEPKWVIKGEEKKELDQGKVGILLHSLAALSASDWTVQKASDTGLENPTWKAIMTTKDEQVHELRVGNQTAGGLYHVQIKGQKVVYKTSPSSINRMKEITNKFR